MKNPIEVRCPKCDKKLAELLEASNLTAVAVKCHGCKDTHEICVPKQGIEYKILEIRDAMTFIPVMAFKMVSTNSVERYYLKRMGWGEDYPMVMVMRIETGEAKYDPFTWGNGRTMKTAHLYIHSNWETLQSGDVVDVEYILKYTDKKKTTEREAF